MITPVNVQLVGLDKVGRTTTINNVSVALGVFLGASISGKTISIFFFDTGISKYVGKFGSVIEHGLTKIVRRSVITFMCHKQINFYLLLIQPLGASLIIFIINTYEEIVVAYKVIHGPKYSKAFFKVVIMNQSFTHDALNNMSQ